MLTEQLAALLALHESVLDWPLVIEAGLAAKDAIVGAGAVTVTVAEAVALPPAPVQVSV